MSNYSIVSFEDIEPLKCPCGFSRRAFADMPESRASVHIVQIEKDSQVHYHRHTTEIYVILEGTGQMELDGQLIDVSPMTAIQIQPGCRHRAIGKMKIINIAIPPFDPSDEYLEQEQ